MDVLGEGDHRVVVGDVKHAMFGHLGTQGLRVEHGLLQALARRGR